MLFRSSKNEGVSASPNNKAKQTSTAQSNVSSSENSTAANKQSTVTPKKDAKKNAKKNASVKKQAGKDLKKCLKPVKQAYELEKQARIDQERYDMGKDTAPFKRDASNSGVTFDYGRVSSCISLCPSECS